MKILLVISLIILGIGIGYFAYQKGIQIKLKNCLNNTEEKFKRLVSLNSIEKITPGGEKARQFLNTSIKLELENQYNKDREFCLKLYK